MKVIIDRIEGDLAVVELDGEMITAPRALFGDAREGDAVMILPLGGNAEHLRREGGDDPHAVFERLRRKRRHRRS